MTDKKTDEKKPTVVAENVIHHPTYMDCSYEPIIPQKFMESEISSNLPLQKLLYFNIFYSIMYFYMLLLIYIVRLWIFQITMYDNVRIIFFFIILTIEILRINNGYQGNLKESFPELISFILLTIINLVLNFVLIIFKNPFPLEFALLLLQIIILALEIIIGIYAINKLVKSQTALFYLRSPHYDKSGRKFDYQKEIEMKRNSRRHLQPNKFDSGYSGYVYDRVPHEENYT